MKNIKLNNITIGPESPCFIIAELGINHNGDMALAKQMIDAAIQAGADAVKVQNYLTEDFVKDKNLTFTYTSQGQQVTETQYELFKRCELNKDHLQTLNDYCKNKNIIFMSTPTSQQTLQDLVEVEVSILKNGSDFLRNLDFIAAMAKTGLPTILSTGMSTLKEIASAVEVYYQNQGKDLALLHCTSAYPTKAEDVHLRKIESLSKAFGIPVGFSDHTQGHFAAISAIGFGASIIEKHFTLDCQLPGPDHWFSADPKELTTLVQGVRFAEKSFGQSEIGFTPSEEIGRKEYILSCVANADLPKDHILTELDIAFSRPGYGVPPEHKPYLKGKRLSKALKQGDVLLIEELI